MPHHRLASRTTTFLVFPIAAALGLVVAGCSEISPTAPTTAGKLDVMAPNFDRSTPTFSYATIDAPGAILTNAQGINAGGDIAGWYLDAAQRFHGFVVHDGTFSTVDYPSEQSGVVEQTQVRGIGADGAVVGNHWNNGELAANPAADHGFERTAAGEFQIVHYPDHLNEIPQRILPDGTILGCRHDMDMMASMHGIVIAGNSATDIGVPASMNNGSTPSGRLQVGFFTDMANVTHGYTIENGAFTPFMVPGSSATNAWDVSPRGDIVGAYKNATGFHGFVETDAGYTTIDMPVAGTTATRVFGVNARGDVVGAYVVGTGAKAVTHAFVATRVQ
ncbi:MAG: hypothetical protein ACJ796_07970 [Gemmatimonadaceae bacterium]